MSTSTPPDFLQEFSGSTSEPSPHELRVRHAAGVFEHLTQGLADDRCLHQPALEASIRLSKDEAAVILPALEDMLNAIAEAVYLDRYTRRDATFVPYHGEEIYRERRFDDEMYVHLLSCRNKLKFKGVSKEIGLDAFELAAAALGFGVVRKEKLVSKDMLASPSLTDLERKIENARKRAKRAAIKQSGLAPYKDQASRWDHFVEWLRFSVLYYRPRRQSQNNHTRLHREQRETMRALAMEVVVETADREQIYHLVDLARRELRRKRHVEVSPTLRALLQDPQKARQFLAKFISDRLDPYIIAPEFQTLDIRQSDRAEKLKLALRLDED